MKKLKCSDGMALSEGLSHHILREVSILYKLKGHPNIVQLLDFQYCPSPRYFVFTFDFAEGGDLSKWIKTQRLGFNGGSAHFQQVRRIIR